MKKLISSILLILASTSLTVCYANTTIVHTNNYIAPAVVVKPAPIVVVKPAPVVVVKPAPIMVKPAPVVITHPTTVVVR